MFSCRHLRVIDVSSNSISTFLPPPNTLLHLEVLRLEYNRLEVFPESLNSSNFPSLQKLFLDSNQIVVLPDVALQMGSITELSMSRNGLTTVPKDFLSSLTGLRVLNLSRNHIGELQALPLQTSLTASNLSLQCTACLTPSLLLPPSSPSPSLLPPSFPLPHSAPAESLPSDAAGYLGELQDVKVGWNKLGKNEAEFYSFVTQLPR